ncbi:uncharacterized protein LOC133193855 [Saccostrea echinata]|uniref:uncharacterized protein LOC133193855 n=1 Tax=Saccostrea echinata TaxID=191078 RepID=UPI002A815440|nr:uncharacterized protein LOC133193855 [Saccostrea echinata]
MISTRSDTLVGVVVLFETLSLCYGNTDIEKEFLEIRKNLKRQEMEIKELRRENRKLRADVNKLTAEMDNLKNVDDFISARDDLIKDKNISRTIEKTQTTKKSALDDPKSNMDLTRNTRIGTEPVAFYAYMSAPEPNPSIDHTLVFDVAKTNLGGGYNEYSGMFSAPSSGVYVFSWTIHTGSHGQNRFIIYVNHDEVDYTFGETDNNEHDYDSDSGTMVVSLNTHDNVYIRSAAASSTYVVSYASNNLKTTFSGWKIN